MWTLRKVSLTSGPGVSLFPLAIVVEVKGKNVNMEVILISQFTLILEVLG